MASGASDFVRLSKAMKAAGQGELRKELHKALRTSAKPLLPRVRQAARDRFPRKGGLNERVARRPLRIAVRTGQQTGGVSVQAPKTDPRLNAGRVWHPVYGQRKPGVVQHVPGAVGFFDDPLRDAAPEIRGDLQAVLRDYKRRLAAEIRGGGLSG